MSVIPPNLRQEVTLTSDNVQRQVTSTVQSVLRWTVKKLKTWTAIGTATDFFNLSYIKDNIFDVAAGTFRGVADGFFVFLKPLSVGNHELQVKTSVTNPTTPSYNFASEAKYNLKTSPKLQTENNITNKSSLNTTLPEQLPPQSINGSKVPKI